MRISAKADYAVRALLELAATPPGAVRNARELAQAQGIPQNFLENILSELRRAGLVHTQRGPSGGSVLARDAAGISLADVLRAVDGPLAAVRDLDPDSLAYPGAACRLPAVWCRLSDELDRVLGAVSVSDLLPGGSEPIHNKVDLTDQE
jgi:Rrf2 family protein